MLDSTQKKVGPLRVSAALLDELRDEAYRVRKATGSEPSFGDLVAKAWEVYKQDTRPASVFQCDEKVLTGEVSPVKIIQNLREYRSDRVWLAAVALIDALLHEDAAHATTVSDAASIAEAARSRLDAVRASASGASDTALAASDSGGAGRSRARRTRV